MKFFEKSCKPCLLAQFRPCESVRCYTGSRRGKDNLLHQLEVKKRLNAFAKLRGGRTGPYILLTPLPSLRLGVMSRTLATLCLSLVCGYASASQVADLVSVPSDSPRWDLQGEAKVTDYEGRKCLRLDGGAAILKDFEMWDG